MGRWAEVGTSCQSATYDSLFSQARWWGRPWFLHHFPCPVCYPHWTRIFLLLFNGFLPEILDSDDEENFSELQSSSDNNCPDKRWVLPNLQHFWGLPVPLILSTEEKLPDLNRTFSCRGGNNVFLHAPSLNHNFSQTSYAPCLEKRALMKSCLLCHN